MANIRNLEEEDNFNELYSRALVFMMKTKGIEREDFERAYNGIKKSFQNFTYVMMSFSRSENLCAYFYGYSTLNSAIARNRFLDAIQNCNELKRKIRKPSLNVISLGGGPGTDMIGFLSALQEFVTDSNKTLNLTIVDKWVGWASFYNINECLIRELDYGNVSEVFNSNNVCSTFMCVDLESRDVPRKYYKDLSASDIVILARVLDMFKCDEEQEAILQNIVRYMKSEALLLIIDSFHDREISGLEQIYSSEIGEFVLSTDRERIFGLYQGNRSKAEISVYVKKAEPSEEMVETAGDCPGRHDGEDAIKKRKLTDI